MRANFIQLIDITLKVSNKILLDGTNLSIDRGEFVAIIGANGIGKSSLLRMLARLQTPLRGKLVTCKTKDIGFAPDTPPLYPYDTAISYLDFICQLKNVKTDELAECMEILDLVSVQHKPIVTLSKGTQQRVNLAQAMINKPRLLLLDEPTNGLDTDHCEKFCSYLKHLQLQGTTIVIASHLYTDFVQNCDYMLKMHDKLISKILTPLHNKSEEVIYDNQYHTT